MNEKNNKIDWKRKLTSRKFWVAIAGFVTGIILAFGGTQSTADTTSGVIMAGAAVVAYVIGEGLADSSPTIIETEAEKKEDKEDA